MTQTDPVDLTEVSPREREVLDLLGEQLTHEEIGRRLFISVRTVESHVSALRRKLDMPDHRELVRYAVNRRPVSASVSTALPVTLTSFVGREAEIGELAAALRQSRLVTAAGAGGAGKTRLALAVAQTAVVDAPGGVRWVDLVPVGDPASLAGAVAQACGATVTSRRGPIEASIDAITDQSMLLVLDNAEHLVNAVALLAERLLTGCPALRILVTSRVRLALPFERVFRVAGLSGSPGGDAVALFVERAMAAGAPPPTAPERTRIAEICTALGGLALAVELAAVRMPALGLDGVERGLLAPTELLSGGARLNPRQRSMRETLDWSVALLDPAAATAIRRLGVLITPFTVEAAQAVAGFDALTPSQIPALVEQLVDHHLLATTTVDGRVLHRMLEPVRQYALSGIEAADRTAFGCHLYWCSRQVSDRQSSGVDGVPAMADDVRAALAWASSRSDQGSAAAALARAFGLLLFRNGRLAEARQRMEQAAGFDPAGRQGSDDLARAAAIAKCVVLGEEALRLEQAAAERARSAGDAVRQAAALARAAELLTRFPGMFAAEVELSAEDLLRQARQLAPTDPVVVARVKIASAGYAAAAEQPPLASRADEALAAARACGDPVVQSAALDAVTGLALLEARVVDAYHHAQQRIARLPSWRDDPAVALELKDALHTGVFCAVGAGQLGAAAELARGQQQLEFLSERRDLAEDEVVVAAALAGDWDVVFPAGQRFLADWTAAGRPPAAGWGLAPAAVALAYGLTGNPAERLRWLGVLAAVRGPAARGVTSGADYDKLFEAMMLLHEGKPQPALDLLSRPSSGGLYGFVFAQWRTALHAEAAVLAASPAARTLLQQAESTTAGNPIGTAIVRRAAAFTRADRAALAAVSAEFTRAGCPYQAARTHELAGQLAK